MEYHSGGSLPLLGRPRYCPGANANGGYLCETGHCCGETGCCTYYYELWWFWLLWTVLILFSCCCAYRHRRAKLRVQQQQRQREISLLAYHGASSYTSSMLDLSFLASLKLPSYEEVAAQPSTPPPPYSSVFTTPRYPQPPRAADPHLLTQHDPLLHRPLSDGPSSLSSDNSSSCSCDSCCPSSPCSSSLSAPVTYETDTSHATTPSEAPPLALDITMETIAAAATCLEVNEMQLVSERTVATVAVDLGEEDTAGMQERRDSSITVAVITRAASAQPLPSPGSEVDLLDGTTSPIKQQLDAPCTPIVGTGSPVSPPCPGVAETALPSIKIMSTEGPAEDSKITSISGPSTPTASQHLNLLRTFDTSVPSSPTSVPSPDVGKSLAMITSSATLPTLDPKPCHVSVPEHSNLTQVPEPVTSNLIQVPEPVTSNLIQVPEPVTSNLNQVPEPVPINFFPFPDPVPTNLIQTPDPVQTNIIQTLKPVQTNPTLVPNLQPRIIIVLDCETDPALNPAQSDLTDAPTLAHRQVPELSSGLLQQPGSVAVLAACLDPGAGPALVPSESDHISPLPSNDMAGFSSGSGSCPLSTPSSSSCPAITIESESLPPPAPALLLDPLTALHQSSKDGSSSGHASSLSPSPRATQSPPKQTLFSPCVDVYEPGPPSWEDGEDDQEEDDQEEDDNEDEDMGADESQYRHRRLTGDSGIEVCRCQVGEEEEEEEEEEEDVGERKQDGRRGGDKKGGGDTDLHDSVDCPARGQTDTGDGLILCNATSSTAPMSEDGSEVVVVMETV